MMGEQRAGSTLSHGARRRVRSATWLVLMTLLTFGPLQGLDTEERARADGGAAINAGATEPEVPRRTPAVYQDPRARSLLLTRTEFDELRLKMVGMGSFLERPSVFIQHPGMRDQMIYEVGDVVGGFKIISIQPDYTVFERGGVQLWLAIGTSPNVEETERPQEDLTFAAAPIKHSETRLKTKTAAYADARIIGSGTATEIARPGASVRFRPERTRPVLAASDGLRFIVPLPGRISSGFGYRKAPMGGGSKYHSGVDIAAPSKTPIRAAAEGEVIEVGRTWSKGRHVILRHADGYATAYFHLASAAVSEGEWVAQGTVIGYEGSTGISTGPHLHFEIHKNEQPVDPALYIKEFAER